MIVNVVRRFAQHVDKYLDEVMTTSKIVDYLGNQRDPDKTLIAYLKREKADPFFFDVRQIDDEQLKALAAQTARFRISGETPATTSTAMPVVPPSPQSEGRAESSREASGESAAGEGAPPPTSEELAALEARTPPSDAEASGESSAGESAPPPTSEELAALEARTPPMARSIPRRGSREQPEMVPLKVAGTWEQLMSCDADVFNVRIKNDFDNRIPLPITKLVILCRYRNQLYKLADKLQGKLDKIFADADAKLVTTGVNDLSLLAGDGGEPDPILTETLDKIKSTYDDACRDFETIYSDSVNNNDAACECNKKEAALGVTSKPSAGRTGDLLNCHINTWNRFLAEVAELDEEIAFAHRSLYLVRNFELAEKSNEAIIHNLLKYAMCYIFNNIFKGFCIDLDTAKSTLTFLFEFGTGVFHDRKATGQEKLDAMEDVIRNIVNVREFGLDVEQECDFFSRMFESAIHKANAIAPTGSWNSQTLNDYLEDMRDECDRFRTNANRAGAPSAAPR